MSVALGFKAHSGWAAFTAVASDARALQVIERGRIELVEESDAAWCRAPYHAADGRDLAVAERLVERAIAAVDRAAQRHLGQLAQHFRDLGHGIVGCGVLVGAPMPAWSVAEIMAVHFRMHQAEGVMFQRALARAATDAGLRVLRLPEKELAVDAASERITALGKGLGPPWGQDQKRAAAAAIRVLGA